MRGAGLTATELGPDGFLPADTAELHAVLRRLWPGCVGGFVPVRAARRRPRSRWRPRRAAGSLVAAGAGVVVLAAATGSDGYDSRPVLDETQWATCWPTWTGSPRSSPARGLLAVLHPHVGTMVETRADVDRVLAGSSIPLCLDTGHLLIGGTDPLELTRQVPDRIAHAHLKDVDAALAAKVQSGELTYTEAVDAGMYMPLGTGDVDIAGIVTMLRGQRLRRLVRAWSRTPSSTASPTARGRWRDVLASVAYLHAVTRDRETSAHRGSGRVPDRRGGDRRPRRRTGHRLVAVAARDRSGRRCSPRSTASSGFWTATRRSSTIPRSTSSTTRWPTRCTRRGISRPSRAGQASAERKAVRP